MNAFAPPMGHDMFEALAVAWAMDSLEPADQVIFEEHRETCAICERTVLATLELAAELAYGVPDIEPPPQLRRRIMAAATPRPPVQGTSPEDGPWTSADATSSLDTPWRRQDDTAEFGGPAGFAALDLFGDSERTRRTRGSGTDGTGTGDGRAGDGRTGDGRIGDGGAALGRTDGLSEKDAGRPDGMRRVERPVRGRRRAVGARRAVRDRPASGRSGSRRRIASVLAAVALVGISAATTWEVTRPAAVTAPVAAADRTAVLSAPTGSGTVATVVVRGGRTDVVTDALTPNAQGRSFYMWGVPAGGNGMPQLVGTFQVTTSGLHSYPVRLTGSVGDYPVLAISEEATGSAPVQPGDVLGRGALDH